MAKDRIAIFGDVHANLEAFTVALDIMKSEGVTHYVCIGDIVGYNANPKECLDMLHDLQPIAVVRGNHDEYIGTEQELIGFNPQAASAVKWTRNQLNDDERKWLSQLKYETTVRRMGTGMPPFRIVHGTLDTPQAWGYIMNRLAAANSMQYQTPNALCFCGHTHIPMFFVMEDSNVEGFFYPENEPVPIKPNMKYLFNVGSIGQPRDGDPRGGFAIYTPEDAVVQLYRFNYDIATTQQKIREAGLPERLAERLEYGR